MNEQVLFLYGTIITLGTFAGLVKYWQSVRKEENDTTRIHYENWGN